MKTPLIIGLLLTLSTWPMKGQESQSPDYRAVPVAPTWSASPVNPALLTHGDDQFIAFYDANRQMTLGQRKVGSNTWKFKALPSVVDWDSHKYIALGMDRDNCLHVSGNMHVQPLVYFRGSRPLDIDSVEQVKNMVDSKDEDTVTYPIFFHSPTGELVFSYRKGMSGNGDTILNVYNEKEKNWTRLLGQHLFNGENKCNAYPSVAAPVKGPDGYSYISFLWRDTPDASTCHDLSLIRSKDLVHWESISGKPVSLPITPETPGIVVDPIPANGGIVNSFGKVGFGPKNEVILSYTKFDADGKTQLYFARAEDGRWMINQASNWSDRFEFKGGGTIGDAGIAVWPLKMVKGKMTIQIYHKTLGTHIWEIDPVSMKIKGQDFLPKEEYTDEPTSPQFKNIESTFPDMRLQFVTDSGTTEGPIACLLRWESLPPNRDQPRKPPLPEPSMLQLIEFKKN